jgi:hypothetical protein
MKDKIVYQKILELPFGLSLWKEVKVESNYNDSNHNINSG